MKKLFSFKSAPSPPSQALPTIIPPAAQKAAAHKHVARELSAPSALGGASAVAANGHSTPASAPVPDQKWIVGKQYPVIQGELYYMAIRSEEKLTELMEWQEKNGIIPDRIFFTLDEELQYFPFCADFGPMNFGMTYRFCKLVEEQLEVSRAAGQKAVFYTSADPIARTNGVCLLGLYLVLQRGFTAEQAMAPLTFAGKSPFLGYRDASFQPVTFELDLLDIMRGMYKAKKHKLVDLEGFDLELYEYCDHPSMADLHVIMPDKFVAFKGPHATTYYKDGVQFLAPSHYFELFKKLNVSAVVRLNEEKYSAQSFRDAGINHYDIYFDDCTVPDMKVMESWFEACRQEKGALAVHCKAGLGRTGTLICAWLMRKFKFTGREAIGYIRVIRPGSILGPQQEYLVENEQLFWSMGDPDIPPGKTTRVAPLAGVMESEEERAAARRRAQENTDAMNRNAAMKAAAGAAARR
mmetsp:Transcript_21356/g.44866  ORF Transcript_21356/g.44866 Transcript_21356/m.44866 type:complete len:466 (-) Transcript_21356:10-1407(-)